MMRTIAFFALLPLTACASQDIAGPKSPYEVQQQVRAESPAGTLDMEQTNGTVVASEEALDRLRNNSGITLQWIGWEKRGELEVTQPDNVVMLKGRQQGSGERPGTLSIDGKVTAIEKDRFTFDGTVRIADAPDPGRDCVRSGPMEFLVTQDRKYWRLQDMVACDGLTDYVDIYF